MKQNKFARLYTAEGKEIVGQPWDVYPRPQMKRKSFLSLNGEWDFYANDGPKETIIVPFPPESLLSGINRDMGKYPTLKYRKIFTIPKTFIQDRVLLHFGAVDQICRVKLNGVVIGEHHGGYDAFTFDITSNLLEKNILEVEVTDELGNHVLPYGKQRHKRGGMWYTPITGIWQTVWLESVPESYIKSLKIDTGVNYVEISADAPDGIIILKAPHTKTEHEFKNGRAHITIKNPRYWSPQDPFLYKFSLRTEHDEVESYFALRTLEIKEIDGVNRLCLNGEPYFFNGLLDQGYFSDGIYTPASPESYTRDIQTMKSLGFNTLRKHIKVEPEYFYYECDRLGMIVFQDMVNNGKYSFLRDTAMPTIGLGKLASLFAPRTHAQKQTFISEMEKTVKQLYNHPCVCYWTIFNEGWGQFDANKMYTHLHKLDNTRFIDSTSGWFKKKESDVESLHVYFKPVKLKPSKKPIVLSEFGGYSYNVKDHVFNPNKTYGYKKFESREDFENAFVALYENEVIPNIKNGLCGAIYTQVSDVEDETNGLMTYDRAITKVSRERLLDIAEKLKI